jgi:DNA oxidative demethylase
VALELIPRQRRTLAPGVVHVPDWLSVDAQRHLVGAARAWAREGPGARVSGLA